MPFIVCTAEPHQMSSSESQIGCYSPASPLGTFFPFGKRKTCLLTTQKAVSASLVFRFRQFLFFK